MFEPNFKLDHLLFISGLNNQQKHVSRENNPALLSGHYTDIILGV